MEQLYFIGGFILTWLGIIALVGSILSILWQWLSLSLTYWFVHIKIDWSYNVGIDKDFKKKPFFRTRLLFITLNPKVFLSRTGTELSNELYYMDFRGFIPKVKIKHQIIQSNNYWKNRK